MVVNMNYLLFVMLLTSVCAIFVSLYSAVAFISPRYRGGLIALTIIMTIANFILGIIIFRETGISIYNHLGLITALVAGFLVAFSIFKYEN